MGLVNYSPPIWKVWLSYIFPITLETTSSDLNEFLEVRLLQGQLQLCTETAVYSFERKYDNFSKLFDQVNFDKIKGSNVLILGLGLGSVIQLLEDYKNKIDVTAVELDEEIVFLAEKYVLHKVSSHVEVVMANAMSYVSSTNDKYDLICMDVFIDDYIPEEFTSKEFCEYLKSLLTESGHVIYNTPAFSDDSATLSSKFYKNVFHKVFPTAQNVHVHKNYMLLSDSDLLQG